MVHITTPSPKTINIARGPMAGKGENVMKNINTNSNFNLKLKKITFPDGKVGEYYFKSEIIKPFEIFYHNLIKYYYFQKEFKEHIKSFFILINKGMTPLDVVVCNDYKTYYITTEKTLISPTGEIKETLAESDNVGNNIKDIKKALENKFNKHHSYLYNYENKAYEIKLENKKIKNIEVYLYIGDETAKISYEDGEQVTYSVGNFLNFDGFYETTYTVEGDEAIDKWLHSDVDERESFIE